MAIPFFIIDKKYVAEETLELTLGCGENSFSFRAGQYIKLTVPDLLPQGAREASRVFSICSSPNKKNLIRVVFRVSPSAFKQYLVNAPIGAKVEVTGPFGEFTPASCLETGTLNMVFIAGGVGIAPFLSMIRFAAEEKIRCPIALVYAARDEKNSPYLEELKALEREYQSFSLLHKLGPLENNFLESSVKNYLPDSLFYIAGPAGMALSAKKTLEEMGADRNRIKLEIFW